MRVVYWCAIPSRSGQRPGSVRAGTSGGFWLAEAAADPDLVQLAVQLIEPQIDHYDPSGLEDRYETRLGAMLEAKLKGEGLEVESEAEPDRGNVIDLMTALKASLQKGAEASDPEATSAALSITKTDPAPAPAGKGAKKPKPAAAQAATKPERKRA